MSIKPIENSSFSRESIKTARGRRPLLILRFEVMLVKALYHFVKLTAALVDK